MNSELIKDHQTYLKANQKVTLIECSAIRDSRDFLFLFHKNLFSPLEPLLKGKWQWITCSCKFMNQWPLLIGFLVYFCLWQEGNLWIHHKSLMHHPWFVTRGSVWKGCVIGHICLDRVRNEARRMGYLLQEEGSEAANMYHIRAGFLRGSSRWSWMREGAF